MTPLLDESGNSGLLFFAMVVFYRMEHLVFPEVVYDILAPHFRKINVGAAYQVEVPDFVESIDLDAIYHDNGRVYETLLWNPKNINDNDPKTEESCKFLTVSLL